MKMICIMGGPKKYGNTFDLVKKVVSEMSKNIIFDIEYLFLAEQTIAQCKGCFSCIANGPETCTIKDDMAMILAKMTCSDGLILAAPTYTENVPALTKQFFDRLSYLYHRPIFFGKNAIVVSTVGFYGIKGSMKQLSSIRDWGYNVTDELGIIPAQYGLKYVHQIEQRTNKRIEKVSRRFSKALRNPVPLKLSLKNYLIFQAIKASVTLTREWAKADFEYYGDKEYYFDVKIPLIIKILGMLVRRLVVIGIKNRYEPINGTPLATEYFK